ncbi:MAG: amino acid ABC transporter substrate-binding protein [Chloroflexi bacterium]|nr:amino acid ABC transporter substrate-binding protein [Chloroflexota bacterium]
MKRTFIALFSLLILASLVLTACGPKTTPTPEPVATEAPSEEPVATEAPAEPAAVEKTVVVGFTASLTGKYEVSSTRQTNGLKLWMDQVNAAGGVKLADGTVITFESKFYDDESSTDRVQELYTKLATEDNADFLISPYSSGLTAAAAVIAEQYGKVMITTGAASDSVYKQGYTLVYQAYTPSSRYLTGAVDALANADPDAKKIAIVYENAKFSTGVVEAMKAYAESKGYEIVLFEGYDKDTTDFNPIINKVANAQPDAVMGGGHFQDGSAFAKQLYEKNIESIKFVALLVAPPEPTFAELGDAAVGVVGPSQWEPLAAYTPDFGPTSVEFEDAYKAAYGEEPSYHSAGGYVAGLILQKAIETAGSLDTDALIAALDAMDMTTFYGDIQFDTSEELHGLQIGHSMVYIQWQKDADGNLVKQVIWPLGGATAELIYPIR